MIAALSPKPQLVTRRLGDLSAILSADVQTVIWSRSIPHESVQELEQLDHGSLSAVSFLSLTTDPFDRVQHQLRKAGVRSHFLTCDITLLVTVFGDLTKAARVRIRLEKGSEEGRGGAQDIRLVAAYGGRSPRATSRHFAEKPRRFASYVGMFRGDWSQDHPLANPVSGLCLTLDPIRDRLRGF